MRCLPESYVDVSNRCVTNTDGELIGLGFDGPDGGVVRLALSLSDAEALARSILCTTRIYRARTNSHSNNSSGSPSLAVSPQDGV